MIMKVVTALAGFVFDTAIGKGVVAAAAAAAVFGAWLWSHDAKVEARAETKIITQSKEAGKQANAKAAAAHRAARRPGAPERLLQHACRDC
jgi:Flp pilus assembly protein TadB